MNKKWSPTINTYVQSKHAAVEAALQKLRKIFSDQNLDDLPGHLKLEALFTEAGQAFRILDSELPMDVDLAPAVEALRKRIPYTPRSFHPDDAFEPSTAAQLLESGAITQEVYDLCAATDGPQQAPITVGFFCERCRGPLHKGSHIDCKKEPPEPECDATTQHGHFKCTRDVDHKGKHANRNVEDWDAELCPSYIPAGRKGEQMLCYRGKKGHDLMHLTAGGMVWKG